MKKWLHESGFTLIELLVVISIIAILSSIILAALKNAHTQANEAVIREELVEFRNLYESNYPSGGNNYSSLQPAIANQPWQNCQVYTTPGTGYVCQMSSTINCSQVFNHDTPVNTNAISLCDEIVASTGNFEIGVTSNVNLNQHYSLVAYLPNLKEYMCMGSSGNNSTFTTVGGAPPSTATGETGPGCPGNP